MNKTRPPPPQQQIPAMTVLSTFNTSTCGSSVIAAPRRRRHVSPFAFCIRRQQSTAGAKRGWRTTTREKSRARGRKDDALDDEAGGCAAERG